MRTRGRIDENQPDLVVDLREIGASVMILSSLGDGYPDLCVGYRNRNYLFEVKNPDRPKSRRKLTPAEAEWAESWRGQNHVIETLDDALKVIGAT